eukprot:COSAG01_NODE_14685_length_1419_cov_1.058957_4_plen_37_part_01
MLAGEELVATRTNPAFTWAAAHGLWPSLIDSATSRGR